MPTRRLEVDGDAAVQGSSQPRIPVACDPCRKRKRKCDRAYPQCSTCAKSGIKCRLPGIDAPEISPTGEARARRIPKAYVELLEAQIASLNSSIEAKNEELLSLTEASESNSTESPIVPADVAPTTPHEAIEESMQMAQSDQGASLNRQEDLGSLPVSTEALLSLSKMNESREKGFFGARLLLSNILSTDGGNPFQTVVLRGAPPDIFSFSSVNELSSTQLRVLSESGDALIKRYEMTIHTLYPFMPMDIVKELLLHLQSRDSSTFNLSLDNFAQFSLSMIVSIIFLLGEEDVPFAEYVEGQFFFSALSRLKAIFESDSLLNCIRALLLLSIYSLYKPSAGSSWHLVGFAMRTCVLQGYHSRQRMHTNSDNVEEPAQWAFWSCYALERTLCLALDRLPSISDSDISTTPPTATQTTGELSNYWISYHWLLSSLTFGSQKSDSMSNCIHALHSWKLGQPEFPEHLVAPYRATVQKHLDNAYLAALTRFIMCEQDVLTIPMAKLSFLASAFLISQVGESNKLSWLAGVQVFRAGLLCLSSSSTVELVIGGEKLSHHIDRSVKLCTQLLGRICASFGGLGAHASVFEVLADLRRNIQLPVAVNRLANPQELIEKLPSSLSRNMATKALSTLGTTCVACPTEDEMVALRVSKFMARLTEKKEEDKTLYGLVFDF